MIIFPLAFVEWFIATVVIPMAIGYGLSYLGGMLFGQDPPEAKDEPKGQSFAWEPHTTFQEGIPRPACFGRNLHYGNVVMQWTDVDIITGNEVLYKALDYGQGPVQGVVGGIVSDSNKCLAGTPEFNILVNSYVNTWYQTAANVNDDDKTTRVGFYSKRGNGDHIYGRFNSIITFASTTIDRVEYVRHWRIDGCAIHSGYEKVYLYYAADWHLIRTRNITTEGQDTDTLIVESGGPWVGVTKVKIEVEMQVQAMWFFALRQYSTVDYRLYELRAWRLEDVPVFLNGQPAHNFKEAVIRGRLGTLDQTCMAGFEKNKLQYAPETTVVYGEPVRWTTPNKFADDIEFTLAWLRGLYFYSSDGKIRTHSVGVKVEVSERDAEDWSTVLETTVSANQLKQLYKIYRINTLVPDSIVYGTKYDVRFSKTTEDKCQSRYGDEMQLRSVREVVDVAFTHPGRALLGVIVEATERLQGHVDVTWETDDKLVQVYNSETKVWDIEFSRNRAYVDLAIRTQPIISGDGDANPWTIERYEGLSPDRIDLNKWYEWAQFCDALVPSGLPEPDDEEKRMPCDIICDRLTNVWSIAYEIAQIGRMYPYWQGIMLTGWIDKVTTEDIDLITMDNTMANSWKSGYAGYGEMAGSVKVFYKDSQQGYARKPRPVHNANAGLYTRVIALEGVGVTNESLATRVGNHVLKRNELIKNINSVRMGREALRKGFKLGRVVRVQCNVPNWGQAFRVITSPTNSTCELDRVIEGVLANDLFWVKTAHATTKVVGLNCYTVQSVAGKVVTITTTWAAGRTPQKNHMAAVGIAGSIKLRRIIKIQAVVENYFDVDLETYNTDLFLSDGVDPELTNPDYAQPVTEVVTPITRQMIADLISDLAPTPPKIIKPQLFNCKWVGDDVDTVEWSKANPDEPILLVWQGETYEITAGDTTLEYIYWDSESPTVFLATNSPSTALAAGMYLACTNKNGVEYPADMAQMTHGAIIQVGTLIAAQIVIGGINALGLMNAPAEAGADVTGSHQGDISLANLGEKSVDSLVDGTYAKMLAVWKHGSDPTKMDLSKGFAASITTAQIGLLAVHTAQIENLNVTTLKIANEAVTILTAAQDDAWWYLDPSPMSQDGFGLWRVGVWTAEFTSTGAPCQIVFDTSVDGSDLTSVSKSMHAIFRAVDDYADYSISAIALVGTDAVKITTTAAHNLITDDFVWLWDILGTVELNDAICKVTLVSSTEFTLQLTRSDWFTAYTSGGTVRQVDLWGLRYGYLYPGHDTPIHISLFDEYLEAGKGYQYIGAARNRNTSEYGFINEGSTIIALEIKK